MESLGEKIYNLRNGAGLSQDSLAEQLSVSRQTVSRWETDTSKPAERNIKSLCAIFGVDENYFSAAEKKAAVKAVTDKKGLIVFAVAAAAVLLVCCIVACCVASYVSFMPSYINGLNNAAAHRFQYIGIVCISVGALLFSILVCLLIVVIKSVVKRKRQQKS